MKQILIQPPEYVQDLYYMTLRKSNLSAELVQACSHLPACSPRSNTTTTHTLALLDRNKGKGTVKFTLEQATEAQRGVDVQLYSLTSALDGADGQRHAPATLPSGKRPGTHCIGGWVGTKAGLVGCGKSRPHRDSISGPSSPQQVAIPTELSRPTLDKSTRTNWKCGLCNLIFVGTASYLL